MTPIPILDLGTWLLLEAIVSGTINLCVFSEKFILGNLEKFIGFFRRRCCKMRNFGLKISVNIFPFYNFVFYLSVSKDIENQESTDRMLRSNFDRSRYTKGVR